MPVLFSFPNVKSRASIGEQMWNICAHILQHTCFSLASGSVLKERIAAQVTGSAGEGAGVAGTHE